MNWRKLLGIPEKRVDTAPMGSTKCGGCGEWSYDVIQKWEDDPEGKCDSVSTCTGCGSVSRWIYGPGLMLCLDDDSKKEPEPA